MKLDGLVENDSLYRLVRTVLPFTLKIPVSNPQEIELVLMSGEQIGYEKTGSHVIKTLCDLAADFEEIARGACESEGWIIPVLDAKESELVHFSCPHLEFG
jgi:hypothetical protein